MSSPAIAPTEADEWISGRQVRRILSLGITSFEGLVSSGRITVRRVPGARTLFLRSEIESLARRSTRPAQVSIEELRRD